MPLRLAAKLSLSSEGIPLTARLFVMVSGLLGLVATGSAAARAQAEWIAAPDLAQVAAPAAKP